MSWYISTSGKRAEVKVAIDAQVNPDRTSDQKLEWERARLGLHLLVDSTTSTHLSLNGNGSAGGPISVSVSCWNVAEEPATALTDTAAGAASAKIDETPGPEVQV